MGKGALRPFFNNYSLKSKNGHEKRRWTKCFRILSHPLFLVFVNLIVVAAGFFDVVEGAVGAAEDGA